MPRHFAERSVNPPLWTSYLALALCTSLVGTYVALSKPLVAVFPVFLLAWLRFGIAGIALLPWMKKPAEEPALTGNTKLLLFLESFIGNFLFSLCMLAGVSMSNAVNAGVIMASIPAACAVLGWLFLKERVTPRIWIAVALAVLGIALVSVVKHEGTSTSSNSLLGNALLFVAVLCEAAYAVIGKKLLGTIGPKRIAALINAWGFMLVTPFGLWAAWQFDFTKVGAANWALLVFYAVTASMITVWLWMTGAKRVPASQAGVFMVFLPISSALVGVAFLNESISRAQGFAFGLALLGVVLATMPSKASAS